MTGRLHRLACLCRDRRVSSGVVMLHSERRKLRGICEGLRERLATQGAEPRRRSGTAPRPGFTSP